VTLTEFLLARIAEDEAGAERAEFIADFNQARILDECEAKRRIVEECVDGLRYDIDCGEGHGTSFENILQILALPYIDHPDFRDEWKFWKRRDRL